MNERRAEQRRKREALNLHDARNGRRRQQGKAGWWAFGFLFVALVVVAFVGAYLFTLTMM